MMFPITMFLLLVAHGFFALRQILPNETVVKTRPSEGEFAKLLNDGKPIILFFHGNAGHRASATRVSRYKLVSQMGYHALAIDYRGMRQGLTLPLLYVPYVLRTT